MADFPVGLFRVDGDPGVVRGSARGWLGFGAEASVAAGEIRGLDTSLFVGPEAERYRDGLTGLLPPHLEVAGRAYSLVGSALVAYADVLLGLQDRMRPLAVRAPYLWEAVQAERQTLSLDQAADHRHELAVTAAVFTRPPGQGLPLDPYRSESGSASVSVSQAQQAWDGCVAAATQIKAELQEAITACVAAIRDASGLRFARNPHGVGSLVAGVKGFVKDHAGALAKLSGVLKTISAVTGLLSFIPVVGEAALTVSLVTGGAALALDASTMWASNRWSVETLGVDALVLAPAGGKLAGKGIGLIRTARTAETATQDGVNVARVGAGDAAADVGGAQTSVDAEHLVKNAIPVGSGLKSDAQHAASSFGLDKIGSDGSVFKIKGGDGKIVTVVQVPEHAGRYEWIVNAAGDLTHARYVPGGSINGIANRP
ncbi:MAG TPA: hypothetical protein VK816_07105 [Jatrophihabitantaceae bacterium]|nr:hypothetical protein [Jatrophihabitantaceae bacterium]